MIPTREQVFTALETLLRNAAIPTVTEVSRRMRLPAEVQAGPGPIVIVWEQPEETKHKGLGIPPTRTWAAWIVVYFQNDDKERPGATIINPVLDAIEAALAPSVVTQTQTLGGIVFNAWIEGTTTVATGDTDTTGFGGAVVPVKILVP